MKYMCDYKSCCVIVLGEKLGYVKVETCSDALQIELPAPEKLLLMRILDNTECCVYLITIADKDNLDSFFPDGVLEKIEQDGNFPSAVMFAELLKEGWKDIDYVPLLCKLMDLKKENRRLALFLRCDGAPDWEI